MQPVPSLLTVKPRTEAGTVGTAGAYFGNVILTVAGLVELHTSGSTAGASAAGNMKSPHWLLFVSPVPYSASVTERLLASGT